MTQEQIHRLNYLLKTRQAKGADVLTPDELKETIELLLIMMGGPNLVLTSTAAPQVDDVDDFGPEGGSAQAMRIARL